MDNTKTIPNNTPEPMAAPKGMRSKMRFRTKFFLIIFSLILMGVLRTGFVFFIIGILPSFVAFYMDVSKDRYTFKSIFACNLSGMLPFIGQMLAHGPSSSILQDIMSRGTNWLIIYASAFIGWLLIKICPMIAQIVIVGMHQTQISRMKNMQQKMEGEWGPEVAQFSQQNDPDTVHY